MSSAQCQHNLNSEGVGSDGNQEAAFCKEAASTKANQPDSAVQGGCLDHQPSSKPTTDRAPRLDDRNSAHSAQNCRDDARAQARQGNKVNEAGSEPCIRIGVTTTPALQSHSAPLWQVVREAQRSFQPRQKKSPRHRNKASVPCSGVTNTTLWHKHGKHGVLFRYPHQNKK